MRDPGLMVPAGSEATSTLNREPGLEVPDSATEAESMVVEVTAGVLVTRKTGWSSEPRVHGLAVETVSTLESRGKGFEVELKDGCYSSPRYGKKTSITLRLVSLFTNCPLLSLPHAALLLLPRQLLAVV